MPQVVVDASPLLFLHAIGRLDLLPDLFDDLVVPDVVVTEVDRGTPELATALRAADWLRILAAPHGDTPDSSSNLGDGESGAIALALHLDADWVVLDDLAARRAASDLGIPVIGTLGLIMAAKRKGLLDAARPTIRALLDSGMWVTRTLVNRVLAELQEAPLPDEE